MRNKNLNRRHRKTKLIYIAFCLLSIFWGCHAGKISKKQFNDLKSKSTALNGFYVSFFLTIDQYWLHYKTDPENFQSVINELDRVYPNKKYPFMWNKHFKPTDFGLINDHENRMLHIYYIGPDKIDDKLKKQISWSDSITYNSIKTMNGDLLLLSIQYYEDLGVKSFPE